MQVAGIKAGLEGHKFDLKVMATWIIWFYQESRTPIDFCRVRSKGKLLKISHSSALFISFIFSVHTAVLDV